MHISEEISSHQNSSEIIDNTQDYNGRNSVNTEEESDVTSIHYINTNNHISMNNDNNYIHKYYILFLSSKNNEDASSGSEYDSEK